jgi:transposase
MDSSQLPNCALRYGITRRTGYKWIDRYNQNGLDGLAERSRRPKSCPHQTPDDIERLIVKCREKHPDWGPEKLLDYLSPRHRDVDFPAKSTVGAIIDRHGLIKRRRRRKPSRHPGAVPLKTSAPNQVWSADFKGQFKMLDGVYNYPLTVTDSLRDPSNLRTVNFERPMDQARHHPSTNSARPTTTKRPT